MGFRSLCRLRDFTLPSKPICHMVLLMTLLLHSDRSWGQIVLTSDGASILKISGLPVAACNNTIAIYKYSGTPQNRATLTGQVEEALAAVPAENRIKLEAGKSYLYSLQATTPGSTTVHSSLLGHTHGAATSIMTVYSGEDGIFPPPAMAGFLHSAVHPSNASGYVKFDGLLKFAKASSKGFLCIPYREKSRNNTMHTTNIIIPFIVEGSEQAATAASYVKPAATAPLSSGANPPRSIKAEPDNMPGKPIVGVTANVRPLRKFVKPDAGLKVKGEGKLLTYGSQCQTEEKEPDIINQDLNLKLFPNPTNGAAHLQYHLQESGEVTVVAYDLQGKAVHALLPKTKQDAGPHQLHWNTADLPSGMYLVRVQTATSFSVEKIMVAHDVHR